MSHESPSKTRYTIEKSKFGYYYVLDLRTGQKAMTGFSCYSQALHWITTRKQ